MKVGWARGNPFALVWEVVRKLRKLKVGQKSVCIVRVNYLLVHFLYQTLKNINFKLTFSIFKIIFNVTFSLYLKFIPRQPTLSVN